MRPVHYGGSRARMRSPRSSSARRWTLIMPMDSSAIRSCPCTTRPAMAVRPPTTLNTNSRTLRLDGTCAAALGIRLDRRYAGYGTPTYDRRHERDRCRLARRHRRAYARRGVGRQRAGRAVAGARGGGQRVLRRVDRHQPTGREVADVLPRAQDGGGRLHRRLRDEMGAPPVPNEEVADGAPRRTPTC